MAERPTPLERKGRTLEGWFRLLMREHNLSSVETAFTAGGFFARAYPDNFHPIVAERRDRAFAEVAGRGSISLEEATQIREQATSMLASARGDTLGDALAALEYKLSAKERG